MKFNKNLNCFLFIILCLIFNLLYCENVENEIIQEKDSVQASSNIELESIKIATLKKDQILEYIKKNQNILQQFFLKKEFSGTADWSFSLNYKIRESQTDKFSDVYFYWSECIEKWWKKLLHKLLIELKLTVKELVVKILEVNFLSQYFEIIRIYSEDINHFYPESLIDQLTLNFLKPQINYLFGSEFKYSILLNKNSFVFSKVYYSYDSCMLILNSKIFNQEILNCYYQQFKNSELVYFVDSIELNSLINFEIKKLYYSQRHNTELWNFFLEKHELADKISTPLYNELFYFFEFRDNLETLLLDSKNPFEIATFLKKKCNLDNSIMIQKIEKLLLNKLLSDIKKVYDKEDFLLYIKFYKKFIK